jgi:hypothetical protein
VCQHQKSVWNTKQDRSPSPIPVFFF